MILSTAAPPPPCGVMISTRFSCGSIRDKNTSSARIPTRSPLSAACTNRRAIASRLVIRTGAPPPGPGSSISSSRTSRTHSVSVFPFGRPDGFPDCPGRHWFALSAA